ncbi:MAG: hypothetical protein H6721_34610, partial [Sandaracinus sp.]|nr:hypothetical protein [Sandaracinus sp.]
MSPFTRLAAALTLAILLHATTASAMCMAPGSFVTPSEGALPPNPSLRVFTADRLPRVASETAMVAGAPETFGDITVQRLDFTIAEGTLTVEVGRTTHEYVIDPAWDRGEAGPAVTAWTTVESYWSCSFTDADVLEVESRAPVFELSWDGGRA